MWLGDRTTLDHDLRGFGRSALGVAVCLKALLRFPVPLLTLGLSCGEGQGDTFQPMIHPISCRSGWGWMKTPSLEGLNF